jgi:putative ABC transport system substrate-binding protein
VTLRLLRVAIGLLVTSTCGQFACAEALAEKVVRLGFVATVSRSSISPGYSIGFHDRLRELGWVRGKNLLVEERWADGDPDKMAGLIAEVLKLKVDVLVTATDLGAMAARKATQTTPIIAVALGDPVASGLVTSLARPGGNFTGLSIQLGDGVPGKCLELLRESLPGASTVAILWNPNRAFHRIQVKELEAVAPKLGVKLRLIDTHSPQGLEGLRGAFAQAKSQSEGAILLVDSISYSNRRDVTAIAAQHRIPTIYSALDFVTDGGLMAYGADFRIMYRRAADYVDKVLRGAAPGDIPIEQSTQLRFQVNLTAAKALGLALPEPVLVRADEIIH